MAGFEQVDTQACAASGTTRLADDDRHSELRQIDPDQRHGQAEKQPPRKTSPGVVGMGSGSTRLKAAMDEHSACVLWPWPGSRHNQIALACTGAIKDRTGHRIGRLRDVNLLCEHYPGCGHIPEMKLTVLDGDPYERLRQLAAAAVSEVAQNRRPPILPCCCSMSSMVTTHQFERLGEDG